MVKLITYRTSQRVPFSKFLQRSRYPGRHQLGQAVVHRRRIRRPEGKSTSSPCSETSQTRALHSVPGETEDEIEDPPEVGDHSGGGQLPALIDPSSKLKTIRKGPIQLTIDKVGRINLVPKILIQRFKIAQT